MSVSTLQRKESISFSIALDQGGGLTIVERHSYFQLPVTYRTGWIKQASSYSVDLSITRRVLHRLS